MIANVGAVAASSAGAPDGGVAQRNLNRASDAGESAQAMSAALAVRAPREPAHGVERTPATDAAPLRSERSAVLIASRLRPGIVAYVRCDGLPLRGGRFPCPRDQELEQRVWHTLHQLEHCDLAREQRGQAEVRFEFGRIGAPTLRVTTVESGGLDPEVVAKCAGLALAATRTTLRPDRMIVRFRFELR
jgi:hypothetical protein